MMLGDYRSVHNANFTTKKILVQENIGLRKRVEELETKTYCAYCGEIFLLDDEAATLVTEHINTCPKHPIRVIEVERDVLRKQLEVANKAIDDIENWYDGHNNIIARDAIAEINRIGGKK